MGWCSPSGPKQIDVTACCFAVGASIFSVAAHLSYANVTPQRARMLAHDEYVLDYLRKKYGYNPRRIKSSSPSLSNLASAPASLEVETK
ncbi:hypothetical protein Cni_G16254 [Canna indica]|uniref:Uncharacterized protein n=1 Tax=Canna indica TaxID=4628 RepID=A0AAQ3KF27_9LILI|nr:hypothetical protein Cni_G16254 [Canna indica]